MYPEITINKDMCASVGNQEVPLSTNAELKITIHVQFKCRGIVGSWDSQDASVSGELVQQTDDHVDFEMRCPEKPVYDKQLRFRVKFNVDGKRWTNEIILQGDIPLQVVSERGLWKETDVRLPLHVSMSSQNPQQRLSAKELVQRIVAQETVGRWWLRGGVATGKTSFLDELQQHLVCAQWRVIPLTRLAFSKSSENSRWKLRKGIHELILEGCKQDFAGNVPEILADHEYQAEEEDFVNKFTPANTIPGIVFLLDEFDVYAQQHEEAYELIITTNKVMYALKGRPNVVKIALIVSDHCVAADRIPQITFDELNLLSSFTVEEVRLLIGGVRLSLENDIDLDDIADRIWIWTRGHPLLVAALCKGYAESRLKNNGSTSVDQIASERIVSDAIEYLICTAPKGILGPSPVKHVRLQDDQLSLLRKVARQPWTPNIAGIELLHNMGLVAKENRGTHGRYKINIPLLRFYLLSDSRCKNQISDDIPNSRVYKKGSE